MWWFYQIRQEMSFAVDWINVNLIFIHFIIIDKIKNISNVNILVFVILRNSSNTQDKQNFWHSFFIIGILTGKLSFLFAWRQSICCCLAFTTSHCHVSQILACLSTNYKICSNNEGQGLYNVCILFPLFSETP